MPIAPQRSLAGGELSPGIWGKPDQQKYQTGGKSYYNALVTADGDFASRPGGYFHAHGFSADKNAFASVALIPFRFSNSDSVAIVLGHKSIRFLKNRKIVTEVPLALEDMTKAAPGVFTITGHPFEDDDELLIAGATGCPELNWFYYVKKLSADTFKLEKLEGGYLDTSAFGTLIGGTAARIYEIDSPYLSEHLQEIDYEENFDVLTLTHLEYKPMDLKRFGITEWVLAPTVLSPLTKGPTNGGVGTAVNEIQELTFLGGVPLVYHPNGGSGTFKFKTTTIGPLNWNDSNGVIQAAFDVALGGGNMTVTGVFNTGIIRFEFIGSLAATDQPLMFLGPGSAWTYTYSKGAGPVTVLMSAHFKEIQKGGARDITGGGTTQRYKTTGINATSGEESLPGYTGSFEIASVSNANPCVIETTADHGMETAEDAYLGGMDLAGMPELNDKNFQIIVLSDKTFYLNEVDSTDFGVFQPGQGAFTAPTIITVKDVAEPSTANPLNLPAGAVLDNVILVNIYKELNGTGQFGFVGTTSPGKDFVDNGIPPDMTKTPPRQSHYFDWPGQYPAHSAYYKQRRAFLRTKKIPWQAVFSVPGKPNNYSRHVPFQADDAINLILATTKSAALHHPADIGRLVLLTDMTEVALLANPLTPFDVTNETQSFIGSSNVRVEQVSGSAVFVESKRGRVYGMAFDFNSNSFKPGDLSAFAAHLVEKNKITKLAYAKTPDSILWCRRDDGNPVGLTLVPEHGISGWHRSGTDGFVEDICVIPEGNEDVIYMAVRREWNGQSMVFLESAASRISNSTVEAVCLDSSLVYDGRAEDPVNDAKVTRVTGLWHLEGRDVAVYADGNVVANPLNPKLAITTVQNGAIDLDEPAAYVLVGIPYYWDFQKLDLENLQGPTMTNKVVVVKSVFLTVENTRGLYASASPPAGPPSDLVAGMKEYKPRKTKENPNLPVEGKTGVIEITISPEATTGGGIFLRGIDPIPVKINAIAVGYE